MTATYATLINTLTADGWTVPDNVPPHPTTLPSRTLLSPTGHLRLHLITTGASTLAILDAHTDPAATVGDHHWQIRAEDPHPGVYLAAARAAHQRIVTDLDGPTLAATLYQHGWYTQPTDPGGHPAEYGLLIADGARRAVYLPGNDASRRYEITLPPATAHTSPVTATAYTPYRVLASLALALAPVPGAPQPATGVYDGEEEVDNQTRADWAREALQQYADRHYGLEGDRGFGLEHGFAAEQALRDLITNALHLLDELGYAERDRETTLRYAYGNYVEERDEEEANDEAGPDVEAAGPPPSLHR